MKAGIRFLIALSMVLALLASPLALAVAADETPAGHSSLAAQGNDKTGKTNNGNADKEGSQNQGTPQSQPQGGNPNGNPNGNQGGNQNGNQGGDKNQSGGNSGAIWTTRDAEHGGAGQPGNRGNDANIYHEDEAVVVGGSNIASGVQLSLTVTRLSPPPHAVVANHSVTTGDDGRFTISVAAGLGPGEYRVDTYRNGHKVASDNFRIAGGVAAQAPEGEDPSGDEGLSGGEDPGEIGTPGAGETPNVPGTPGANETPSVPQIPGNNGTPGAPSNSGSASVPALVATSGSGTNFVVLAETPVVPATSATAVKSLPKAGAPLFAPVILLAGSLLLGAGFGLRRLS